MKQFILFSAIVLFFSLTVTAQDSTYNKKWYLSEVYPYRGVSQNLYYEVRGRYKLPVKSETLAVAKSLSDFIPDYPIHWISNYTSVEISATGNGKLMKARSANDVLSTEQKNILKSADLGTQIIINIKDKNKNSVTDALYDRSFDISMMVIPEVEAEYVGGYQKLSKYLHDTVIKTMYENIPEQFQQGIVNFTVNEKGEITNAKISASTGDKSTDKLLLDAINKMPKWKPAENPKGIRVKQDFQFSVGNGGC
jgi:TonB family protein